MRIDHSAPHSNGGAHFRRLLRQDVYEALLDEFLVGRFVPGERIRDEEIASRLGVSRTPIREALTRLSAAGLVDTSPNRFTRVSELVTPETAEAVDVLEALYVLALPRILAAASESDMLELELIARRIELTPDPDPYDALEALRFFGADQLGSSVLSTTIRAIQPRVLRVLRQRPHVLADAGGIARVSQLIEALHQRDLGSAERTARTLLRSIRASIARMEEQEHVGEGPAPDASRT